MKRCAGFLVTALMTAAVASGAYLESDGDRPLSKPVRPIPPVRPESGVHLPALAQRVTIGGARRWSGLTFYPLELPARHSTMRILTLDQALQRGKLAIREVGEGRVARLAWSSARWGFAADGRAQNGCGTHLLLSLPLCSLSFVLWLSSCTCTFFSLVVPLPLSLFHSVPVC